MSIVKSKTISENFKKFDFIQDPSFFLNNFSKTVNIEEKKLEKNFLEMFEINKELGLSNFELCIESKHYHFYKKDYYLYNYLTNRELQKKLKKKISSFSKINKLVEDLGNICAKNQLFRLFRNLLIRDGKVIHIFDERFFNIHEMCFLFGKKCCDIDFKNYLGLEKIDGSLLNIIKDNDDVLFISKNSIRNIAYAQGKGKKLDDVFLGFKEILEKNSIGIEDLLSYLDLDNYNYSFELVSKYNKVEITYTEQEYGLYPLLIRKKKGLIEINNKQYLQIVNKLVNTNEIFKKIKIYRGKNKDKLFEKVKNINNFEGFVMKNQKNDILYPNRIKLKANEYFLKKLFGKFKSDNYLKKLLISKTNLDIKKLLIHGAIEFQKEISTAQQLIIKEFVKQLTNHYLGDIEIMFHIKQVLGINKEDPDAQIFINKIRKVDPKKLYSNFFLDEYSNTINYIKEYFLELLNHKVLKIKIDGDLFIQNGLKPNMKDKISQLVKESIRYAKKNDLEEKDYDKILLYIKAMYSDCFV